MKFMLPIAPDFQVNDHAENDQDDVRLAALADGGFVAVWESIGPAGFGNSVYAQQYGADGKAVGTNILIISSLVESSSNPSIAILENGRWVVSWNSYVDSQTSEIKAQVVNADGSLKGSVFQVNTFADDSQFIPRTTALDNGGFIVTWNSRGGDGDDFGISARIYSKSAKPVTPEFVVNETTSGEQRNPEVDVLNNGNIVITWQEQFRNNTGDSIGRKSFAKVIDDTGASVVAEFALFGGDDFSGSQGVTALSNGGFVISGWTRSGTDASSSVQIFSNNGALKKTVPVMEIEGAREYSTKVSATPDGGFVVTATVDVSGSNGVFGHEDIYIQRFDASGASVSGPDMVNTNTGPAIYHGSSSVITLADGKIAVVWTDFTADSDGNDVYARVYDARYVGTDKKDVLAGSEYDDVMSGRGGNDKMLGLNGADLIDGGAGNDKLFGAKGGDMLEGGKGRDTLKGGAGKDTLDGAKGNDKMTGGGGADTFIFSAGRDVITDFNAGNNREKIDLSDVAGITGFKDLRDNNATQDGSDLVIDDGAGNTLTLLGLAIGDLDRGDFIF